MILLFFFGSLSAQNVRVKIINSLTGEPVPDAVVRIAESKAEFSASEEGIVMLSVEGFPVQATASAPGFEPKNFKIKNEKITIPLEPIFEALSEVVLRSTIIPQDVLNTPASVSLLRAKDLQRNEGASVMDAVDRVAGVSVLQGALNTNKLSIRGVGSRSQYSSNRVKAYFMEIPLSSGEGETTLDDLPPEILDRAEIIKGPVSSIYGAGLGGVINLYPSEGAWGNKVRAEATAGDFGLFKNNVQASHHDENNSIVATFNHLETDGFRKNGQYNRNSINIYGSRSSSENNTLSVLANLIRLKAFIPSSLNRETFENDPAAAAFTWAAAKGFESYDKGLFGISNHHSFSSNFSNTSSIFFNFRNGYEPRPFDILKEEQVAIGARTKFNLKNDIFGKDSELSFGAELFREWYDTSTFENLYEEYPDQGSVAGKILSNTSQDRNYYNLFAQFNIAVFSKLKLEAGLNFNSTFYSLEDLYAQDEVDQSGDYRYKSILSPRAGAVYTISKGKNIYASISHGFSTPTVAETLTPEGLINTGIKPETGMNYEIGFKGNFLKNRLHTEIAVFSIQVENLLVAERVAEDRYIGRNAGKTDHNGLEFLLNYNYSISPNFSGSAFINGAFNDFTFDEFVEEGTDFSGNKLPAVPANSFQAGVDLVFYQNLRFFATFQQEGEMQLNDENSGSTDSYSLVDLKLSWSPRIFQNWETTLLAGVNNLFDEHYAASIVPNAVGFGGSAPRYFYPGKPRNFYTGISLGYEF
ncbi:TonB-dependent receptor [Actinomadura fibrosa]